MRLIMTATLALALSTAAMAQQPAPAPTITPLTEYTLRLGPDDMNWIGRAIEELPAKIANPLSQRIVRQIEAQNEAHRKAQQTPDDAGTKAVPKEAKP